jgi:MtN3 and saliva related transmembrane protein
MNLSEIFGYIGAFLSAITFMPQVWLAWKTKSVGDLSLGMLSIVMMSVTVWLIYGFSNHLIPVIIANLIVGFLALVLIYFKYTFPKK